MDLKFTPRTFYDFLGFEKHVRQIRAKRGATVPELWYKRPGYYLANLSPDKLFGSGETVLIPPFVEKPDYEFEIALIVGKEGRPKTVEEATHFIQQHCSFTILNDWSARDYQKLDMEVGLSVSHSKSIIGNSLGPCLVPASQFKFDAQGLPDIPMKLTVNGQVRCESNYNTVYWSFSKILSFLASENIGVFPGDILGSGTVGDGCIAEFTPDYPWLKNGDEIVMEAQGIGVLQNVVRIT